MAVADGNGLPPVAIHVASAASPHEVTLVEETLSKRFIADENPARLIGDKAYDSDQLDNRLAVEHGIEMIAPRTGCQVFASDQRRRTNAYCVGTDEGGR